MSVPNGLVKHHQIERPWTVKFSQSDQHLACSRPLEKQANDLRFPPRQTYHETADPQIYTHQTMALGAGKGRAGRDKGGPGHLPPKDEQDRRKKHEINMSTLRLVHPSLEQKEKGKSAEWSRIAEDLLYLSTA